MLQVVCLDLGLDGLKTSIVGNGMPEDAKVFLHCILYLCMFLSIEDAMLTENQTSSRYSNC